MKDLEDLITSMRSMDKGYPISFDDFLALRGYAEPRDEEVLKLGDVDVPRNYILYDGPWIHYFTLDRNLEVHYEYKVENRE